MIIRFRHKGLEKFFKSGSVSGIDAQRANRIRILLSVLNTANQASDMAIAGAHLHPLKGDLAGFWAVRVSPNWRLVFTFDAQGNATDVDLVDYH